MSNRIVVLSPSPREQDQVLEAGPAVDDLAGTTIGIRIDWIWPAFHVVVDEWKRELEARGSKVIVWNPAHDQERDTTESQIHGGGGLADEFFEPIELAIVGLGN
jgi:cobyrinic acid a,c-diamide synthase